MRLPENTSANIALRHASEPHRKPRGKHATTWTTMMTNRFKELNLTWDEASVSDKTKVTLCEFFYEYVTDRYIDIYGAIVEFAF